VRDADLEESGDGDRPNLGARRTRGAPKGEERQQRAGEGHPETREEEGREVGEPDLDDEPGRSPDRAADRVQQDRFPAHAADCSRRGDASDAPVTPPVSPCRKKRRAGFWDRRWAPPEPARLIVTALPPWRRCSSPRRRPGTCRPRA